MPTPVKSDSFESYTAGATIGAPWTGGGSTVISTAMVHSGAQSLGVGSGGNAATPILALGTSLSRWTIDVWMNLNSVSNASANAQYFGLKNSASGNGILLGVTSAGAGVVNKGSGSLFTFSVSVNAWHHYVLSVFQDASVGTISLSVDGTVVGTFSGDTRDNLNNASSNQFVAHTTTIGPSPPAQFWLDDLFVNDDSSPVAPPRRRISAQVA